MQRQSIIATCGAVAAMGLAFIAPGCMARTGLPDGFVEVEPSELGPFDTRAVSADGVVFARRDFPSRPGATLDFWTTASVNDLTGRGYTHVETEEIRTPDGRAGRLLRFAATRDGAGYTYLVALDLARDRVHLAEAGGRSDRVEGRLAEIRKAMVK